MNMEIIMIKMANHHNLHNKMLLNHKYNNNHNHNKIYKVQIINKKKLNWEKINSKFLYLFFYILL